MDGFYSFKPYYKWITFNTVTEIYYEFRNIYCFKPYYKWITFNTHTRHMDFDATAWF